MLLSVRDTGCGIPKEHLHRVFEPFFTTKDTGKGSGLGLSMVYGFVKQSGGHVRIDSDAGQGTTVRIYLPRSHPDDVPLPDADPRSILPATGRPTARPGETILLVDDDENVRRVGVTVLDDLGYAVLEAADAAAALRVLADPERPRIDLLVTDVVLPGGMSGPDLAEEVCAKWPGLPVLFTSGYAHYPLGRGERPIPEARLLGKPYTIDNLALRCRHAIDAAATPDRASGG